ncbi:MAG: peptide chain release factor N(5)-glutamine methyltransferase [Ginsengibacter sp.]
MTISQDYNDFCTALEKIYPPSESKNITDWVFEVVTGKTKSERRRDEGRHKNPQSDVLSADQGHILKKYLNQLLQHTPVQYVLGESYFYKRRFYVNEHVLIPRPETEELVEWIINEIKQSDHWKNTTILDIGTGSGCIPIVLKKEVPDSIVHALDVSSDALKVARKNASDLKAEIDFSEVNFLDEDQWKKFKTFDIVVSNPPYIPITESAKLDKNVTDFEPALALFVEDNDPFIFYEKISRFAQTHLSSDGKIFVEVHEEYADHVKTIFEKNGFAAFIRKDIYGKERMIKAQFP